MSFRYRFHDTIASQTKIWCNAISVACVEEMLASPKFLLRRALACAKLARETSDDDCRARCLRLEQVYRRLAQGEGAADAPPAGTGEHKAMAS